MFVIFCDKRTLCEWVKESPVVLIECALVTLFRLFIRVQHVPVVILGIIALEQYELLADHILVIRIVFRSL